MIGVGLAHLFQPLEGAIQHRFLPSLTGQNHFSNTVRDLIALPAHIGGLGIISPVKEAAKQFDTFHKVTAPLVNHITSEALEVQIEAKHDACQDQCQALASTAESLYSALPHSLQKAVEISKKVEYLHGSLPY